MTDTAPALPHSERIRVLYRVASTAGLAALALTAILATLLIANYVQFKRSDPLNAPALVALRARFAADTGNVQLKNDIRALDMLARRAFFVNQAQLRTGGILLLGAVMMLIVAITVIDGLREKLPDPTGCPGLDSVWGAVYAGRKAITIAGVALVVAALAAGLASHSLLRASGSNAPAPDAPTARTAPPVQLPATTPEADAASVVQPAAEAPAEPATAAPAEDVTRTPDAPPAEAAAVEATPAPAAIPPAEPAAVDATPAPADVPPAEPAAVDATPAPADIPPAEAAAVDATPAPAPR